jgi:hypothetical protein
MRGKLTSFSVSASIALVLGAVLIVGAGRVYSDGASVQFKICPEAAAEISDPSQTSVVYMVPVYKVSMTDDHPPGRVPVREILRQPGISFVKEDGLPIGPAGISMIEASIGEDFPGQRFMLLPGDNEIVLCLGKGYVDARQVEPGGQSASVQFKICPEAAAQISDPSQTSVIYMVPVYQVSLTDDHPPGRVPVREMLRQPGVSFVKEDGLPIGPAGISMIEASIGEDFPGQRFMLLPGDNEIVLCSGKGYVDARQVEPGGQSASVQFKICPEAAAEISDPDHTSLIYMVEVYQVAVAYTHAPGRVSVGEMLRQPGVSFVKEDGVPIGPAGISILETSIGEDFPGPRFMFLPGDNEILVCPRTYDSPASWDFDIIHCIGLKN